MLKLSCILRLLSFLWERELKNPLSLKIALGYNYRNWHFRRSLNFPWQAPEVLTKDGAYTIQEERDVRNAMQLCSESFDL